VLRLIVGHGAFLGAIGIAIGLVGALSVTRFLRTLLFGVTPFDPVSFVAVSALLSAIALIASFVPALRAARVDPVDALRQD
jgi:ABC-type antimicrobial peptide transport system permease subunit